MSNTGTWLQGTAQTLLAYQITHSALGVGLVTAAQFAGFLVVGPWAGDLATRMGQKHVLIATQALSAAVAATLAFIQVSGRMSEPWLIGGALLIGLATTFALPVQNAMVSALAAQEDAKGAMAMNSVSYNAGRTVSPILYLFVLGSLGAGAAFAINAATFVVFAIVAARVYPGDEVKESPRPEPRWSGVRLVVRKPRLMLLLAMVAAITIADDPVQVLGPAVAGHLGHAPAMWSAYFLSALGLGSVLGSSALPWLCSTVVPWLSTTLPWLFRNRRSSAEEYPSMASRRAALPLALLAVSVVTFALGLNRWLSLVAVVVAGVAALLTGASAQALLLRTVLPQSRTQVMALWGVAWAGTKPIASLADGWLASLYGVRLAAVFLALPAVLVVVLELGMPDERRRALKGQALRWSQPAPSQSQAARSEPVDPEPVEALPPLASGRPRPTQNLAPATGPN